MGDHGAERHVVVVTFDGAQALDVVGPHEVFTGADLLARREGREGYRLSIVAAWSDGEAVVVRTESGLRLLADALPDVGSTAIDTLLLAGGRGVHRAVRDQDLVDWVRAAAPTARRVATVCSGAFLAARAGLLDGMTVTTHWARAERLAAEFPALTVEADAIYRRQGRVWTSAGVTAGIDLALALVDDGHGSEIAQQVARWLVVLRHRPGGQSQYASSPWTPPGEVRRGARRPGAHRGPPRRRPPRPGAGRSRRDERAALHPRLHRPGGPSAGRYVQRVRLESAREALETTDATTTVVAARCGVTAETLRRTLQRHLGVPPDAYRQRFAHHP